ncbi:hypothetical protein ACI65C_004926 [Semiaphis heraclei]
MVYALTTRMTQSTYESFFRIVQEIAPLNYNRLTIITDYKRGLMNAVRIIFPHTKLQGSWFHYRQVLALPHLPAEAQINCRFTMFDGFQIIIEYVNGQQPITRERLQQFLFGYVQN